MVKVNVEFSASYDDLVNIINDLHDREKCLDDLDKTYPIVELLLSRACFEYEVIQPFLDKVSNYMRHKYDSWIQHKCDDYIDDACDNLIKEKEAESVKTLEVKRDDGVTKDDKSNAEFVYGVDYVYNPMCVPRTSRLDCSVPFIELYRKGQVKESDIDDFVGCWLVSESKLCFSEYLGLTKEQYRNYVETGKLDL